MATVTAPAGAKVVNKAVIQAPPPPPPPPKPLSQAAINNAVKVAASGVTDISQYSPAMQAQIKANQVAPTIQASAGAGVGSKPIAGGVGVGIKPVGPGQTYTSAPDLFPNQVQKPQTLEEKAQTLIDTKTPTTPVQTDKDKAWSAVRGSYTDQYKFLVDNPDYAKALGIDITMQPKDLEATLKQIGDRNASDMNYLKSQNALASQIDTSEQGRAKAQTLAGQASMAAQFSQGQEGAIGSSSSLISPLYDATTNQVMHENELRYQSAQAARDQAVRNLQNAQQDADAKTMQALQDQVNNAETKIQEARHQMLVDANIAAKTASDIKTAEANANKIKTETLQFNFEAMGAAAASLPDSAIMSMASQAGVTFGQASAMKAMAVLKSQLSTAKTVQEQQKISLEMQKLQKELPTAGMTEKQKNLGVIQSMIKSGAPKDQIDIAMRAFDIPTAEAYQADINYKNAQVNYQNSATAKNYQDLLTARGEYNTLYGGSAYLPAGGKYEVTNSIDAQGNPVISVGVKNGQSLDLPGTTRREDWCAAFVNDITGAGLGDLYSDKLAKAKEPVPQSGMFFVQPTSDKWGHAGIVESVNLADGTMSVVEANWQKGANGKGIVSRRTMKISDAGGFGIPKNAETVGTRKDYSESQKAVMNNLDPQKLDANALKILKESGLKSADLFTYISNTKKPISADKRSDIETIISAIDDLEKHPGFDAAVGAGFQKFLTPWMGTEDFIPSTSAANFAAKFKSFRDQLTLPALDKLKGSMSDKDIAFLRSASTSLTLDMDEPAFKEELTKLKAKYNQILKQGTDITKTDVIPGKYGIPEDVDSNNRY